MKVSAALATSLALTTSSVLFNTVSAAFCPLTTEGLSGLDTEYELTALGKLEVQSFDTDYVYTTIPAGKFGLMLSMNLIVFPPSFGPGE
jgi:hypothetical protein